MTLEFDLEERVEVNFGWCICQGIGIASSDDCLGRHPSQALGRGEVGRKAQEDAGRWGMDSWSTKGPLSVPIAFLYHHFDVGALLHLLCRSNSGSL